MVCLQRAFLTRIFLSVIQVPADKLYNIVASKTVIGNSNVLHHLTMYGCNGDLADDKVSLKLPAPKAMLYDSTTKL